MEKSTKDILTDVEAHKQLVAALNNVINVINAFKLSGQIENVDRTIILINGMIDRAQIAAKRGLRLDETETDSNSEG